MKVKELIEELKQVDQEIEILIENHEGGFGSALKLEHVNVLLDIKSFSTKTCLLITS